MCGKYTIDNIEMKWVYISGESRGYLMVGGVNFHKLKLGRYLKRATIFIFIYIFTKKSLLT